MANALSLGDRIKQFYEIRSQQNLLRRTNTILRLDGVSFKNFTRGMKNPYDMDLVKAMNNTAISLCEHIQGAKMAFVQSDEISVLVTDYDERETSAWYDYNVQKVVSVSASIATAAFNDNYLHSQNGKKAFFDSRVFQIPFEQEVSNYFLWRQNDCTRNSLSAVAQALYPHSELLGVRGPGLQELVYKKRNELVTMMLASGSLSESQANKKGFNWNDIPAGLKRGRIITRQPVEVPIRMEGVIGNTIRNKWLVSEAPIFSDYPEIITNLLPKANVTL